ncbi:probable LRR receptor-like serine/threonine-protein kinase At3g47570 [Prosopis cineraria]|uniref:probable LRR receptor-like serine/threonine-protein kinase At3g47570 n=1 Tax=Prosopis cineraria TaxID=364024 RepID=UPI00240FD4A8|nr:probable LRR receptor-like serine/threonine-protein kinase At3g47570 [Prosopis cineraria]
MISIEFLDLSQNHLTRIIPKSLESLVYLKFINLSYNSLHGEIANGGPFQNFTAQSFMMIGDLCGSPQLQVQPCRKENKHLSTKMKLLIKCFLPIIAKISIVLCINFLKQKQHRVDESSKREMVNLETPIRISYYDLPNGTNGFDESNLLGSRSFASVYKAILSNGKIVAVKVFNLDLEEALRSFEIECAIKCNLHHRNLIKIISSCSNDDFKSLIMEYMSNGSLDRWLYSHNYCLDILQRLDIMIDVAAALEYLHHGSSTLVVHCDVKPSNVLLDEDMVAHLSDFGIAKLFGQRQLEIYTKTFASIGYMAPVWCETNITTDKSSLLALKPYIFLDPHDFLANWSTSSSPCNWIGVTCNTRHGRVHSLNLNGMDLRGIISPQLGNLSFLVELDLGNNRFHGHIPKELGQLRRLKLLDLSYNEFDEEVPIWIGDLSIPQYLSLHNNSLNGLIPLSICNLSKLEALDLRANNFIEGNIPIDIGRLKYLKFLGFGKNKLSGIIPQTISNLSSLESLSVSYNTLSGGIPSEIGNLPLLQTMYLSNNQLSGSIPSSIFNSSMLQNIELNENHLSGRLPKNICFGLPKLESFFVYLNDLSGEIPSIWHQCKELVDLELSENKFKRGFMPSDIGNLTNLQFLHLYNSNLEGEIPLFLFNMSSLRRFAIGFNNLYGNLPKQMCRQLPLIEGIEVNGNQLKGNIPKSISNCTHLSELFLNLNSFTGFVP